MSITLQKIAGSVLFALILIWAVDFAGDLVYPQAHHDETKTSAAASAPKEGQQTPTGAPDPNAAAPAATPIAERMAVADVAKGEAAAKKCGSCHTFDQGGPSRVGPNLHGTVGRDIAAVAGFAYSPAMQGMEGGWDEAKLDQFLAKPNAMVPGTKMSFAGVADPQERANIIAFLRQGGK